MKKYRYVFIGACIGCMVVWMIEPYLPYSMTETIRNQKEIIVRQDSIITILENQNDSLRITSTEFDEAVKLLNEKK